MFHNFTLYLYRNGRRFDKFNFTCYDSFSASVKAQRIVTMTESSVGQLFEKEKLIVTITNKR